MDWHVPELSPSLLLTTIGVLALSYVALKLTRALKDAFLYVATVSIDASGSMRCSDTYHFFLKWLDANASYIPHRTVSAESTRDETGKTTTKFRKPPSFEQKHYFRYGGAWIQVHRRRLAPEGVLCDDVPWETVTLTTFRFNQHVLNDILAQIHAMFEGAEEDGTKTKFFYANETWWEEFGTGKRRRPLSSVILNSNVLASMIKDVTEFLSSENWYRDRGIPYRRGYLLYGPPGCGKSSFVKAIAGEIGHSISMLSLSAKNLTDDRLNSLMNSTEENSIILLEDIDAAFPSREGANAAEEGVQRKKVAEGEGTSTGRVTLRGLLNALDGVASTEGRIVFLTTNYVQRLDPAMTRPGRVDMKVLLDWPDDDQLERMFARFYPKAGAEAAKTFVEMIRTRLTKPVSMAMVQGLFMMHKEDYEEMLENLVSYFNEQFFFDAAEEASLAKEAETKPVKESENDDDKDSEPE